MSEKKTVPVELAHQLRRQDPHDTDEVIKLMNAASDCLLRLAAAPSAEPVAQGGETNAATRDANADKPREGAAIDTSPAPTRLVQVGDCTCSDHECGQCMRPAAPTLTVERIENVRSWVRRGLTIGNIEAFDELCDLARIGLQCLQAEPVAYAVRSIHGGFASVTRDLTWAAQFSRDGTEPLIVKPEAK